VTRCPPARIARTVCGCVRACVRASGLQAGLTAAVRVRARACIREVPAVVTLEAVEHGEDMAVTALGRAAWAGEGRTTTEMQEGPMRECALSAGAAARWQKQQCQYSNTAAGSSRNSEWCETVFEHDIQLGGGSQGTNRRWWECRPTRRIAEGWGTRGAVERMGRGGRQQAAG
jgi:hypothetical protein